MDHNTIDKHDATEQVRSMATQFAELYHAFVSELRDALGDDAAYVAVTRVLYRRAVERANRMIERAEAAGIPRTVERMREVSDVAYLGWVPALGKDHCPYGVAWNRIIAEQPWFARYAKLYCDVTDTTIPEVFTGTHSHKLHRNVVCGDDACERTYFADDDVRAGKRTYAG